MPPTRTTRDTPSSPAPRLSQKRARPTSPPLTTPRDTFSLPIGTSDHRILYSPSWTIEYAAELFLETYQLGSEWRQHIGTLLRDEAVPAVERALAASALRNASKENLGLAGKRPRSENNKPLRSEMASVPSPSRSSFAFSNSSNLSTRTSELEARSPVMEKDTLDAGSGEWNSEEMDTGA